MKALTRLTTWTSTAALAFLAHGYAYASIFGSTPNLESGIGGSSDIRGAILEVLKAVLSFMALIAVVFIVIGGIRLVVSQGEEQEKDKAKKTIIYVIIGLIVILLARAIVEFIATDVGG
jgi:succinate dehydrogenase/fumarate reductase cytochrome b subunit